MTSIIYVIPKKNDTNELIYKTEADSHTENELRVIKGEKREEIN